MDIKLSERVSACALNRIFGYEPIIARRLIDTLGGCSAVFSTSPEELRRLLGPGSRYSALLGQSVLDGCAAELERLEAQGCRFIPLTDPDYPFLLKESSDAPAGLYFKSDSQPGEVFGRLKPISVVGTRDITPYGKEWCERIVRGIARSPAGASIVSGLAIGVDITAHMAALACGLPTIAVLPTGIDDIYPRRHSVAADKIASSPGSALVTDFPPGTGPRACTFLRRNRIIAALGESTVLIESRIKGGGMITARLASGYGREVFCLPGRIDDPCSQGCNLLIRENLASAITDIGILVRDLGLGTIGGKTGSLSQTVSEHYSGALPEDKVSALADLAGIIDNHRGITVEELAALSGTGYENAARLTGRLETDGFICIDLAQRCVINAKKL